MVGNCCSQGRPPLERLRNLCIACLVLDSLFVLIYGLTALSTTSVAHKRDCYEAHNYTWHKMITFTFAVSAVVAAGGALVHAGMACESQTTERQLTNISRYAHGLVCWMFAASVLEAIAYRKEPFECSDAYTSYDTGEAEDHTYASGDTTTSQESHFVWQVAYPLLWVSWVTGSVASAVMARRLVPLLSELCAVAATSSSQHAMPQTVGMPVQALPAGIPGASPAALAAGFGSHPGGPWGPSGAPQGVTVTGAPCGPASTPGADATGQPGAWPAQGGVVVASGGGVVAQGMPVAGSASDPEKPTSAGGTKVV